jgi:GTP cyclohydrolase II
MKCKVVLHGLISLDKLFFNVCQLFSNYSNHLQSSNLVLSFKDQRLTFKLGKQIARGFGLYEQRVMANEMDLYKIFIMIFLINSTIGFVNQLIWHLKHSTREIVEI